MRQDEPTRPVRVPRLRPISVPIDPAVVDDQDFELRARRAFACDDRETERLPRIEIKDP